MGFQRPKRHPVTSFIKNNFEFSGDINMGDYNMSEESLESQSPSVSGSGSGSDDNINIRNRSSSEEELESPSSGLNPSVLKAASGGLQNTRIY